MQLDIKNNDLAQQYMNDMVRDLGIAHSKTLKVGNGSVIFFKVVNRTLADKHCQEFKSVADEARLLMTSATAPEIQEHTKNLRAVCIQQ